MKVSLCRVLLIKDFVYLGIIFLCKKVSLSSSSSPLFSECSCSTLGVSWIIHLQHVIFSLDDIVQNTTRHNTYWHFSLLWFGTLYWGKGILFSEWLTPADLHSLIMYVCVCGNNCWIFNWQMSLSFIMLINKCHHNTGWKMSAVSVIGHNSINCKFADYFLKIFLHHMKRNLNLPVGYVILPSQLTIHLSWLFTTWVWLSGCQLSIRNLLIYALNWVKYQQHQENFLENILIWISKLNSLAYHSRLHRNRR